MIDMQELYIKELQKTIELQENIINSLELLNEEYKKTISLRESHASLQRDIIDIQTKVIDGYQQKELK